MSVNIYTPDSTKIIHTTSVDFMNRSSVGSVTHLVQFDNSLPIIAVKLYSNGQPYIIPANMDVNVRVRKPDFTAIYNPVLGCNDSRNTVYIEATAQMCAVDGVLFGVIEVTDNTVIAASGRFDIEMDVNPVNSDMIESSSEGKSIRQFINLAQSYAIGGTGTREDEDTDNAKYYKEQVEDSLRIAEDAAEAAIAAETNAAASAEQAHASELNIVGIEEIVEGYKDDAKESQENAKESENNAEHFAQEIEDLLERKLPTIYIDWGTRELMYSGGLLTLWVDENGFLCWGSD